MKAIWIIGSILLLNASAIASCPQLEGAYLCPKTETQDELYFELERQTEENGTTHYTYHYEQYPDSKTTAAPEGYLNEKWEDGSDRNTWAYCMNNQMVMFAADSTKGWIQQTYLDQPAGPETKKLVISVKGKVFMSCPATEVRIKK